MARYEEISALLQRGKAKDLAALVTEELEAGTPPKEILTQGLIVGMGIVGTKFKNNEIFVPEVLIAARAMNAALAVLKPALADSGVEPVGTAVICTVKGDLHDIGKNLVKMMIEGTGIRVIDLGVDCPAEKSSSFTLIPRRAAPGNERMGRGFLTSARSSASRHSCMFLCMAVSFCRRARLF